MTLGKVVGTVVATRKDEKLIGNSLMIVQEVDLDNELIRQYTVAVDSVGAGIGEIVLTAHLHRRGGVGYGAGDARRGGWCRRPSR